MITFKNCGCQPYAQKYMLRVFVVKSKPWILIKPLSGLGNHNLFKMYIICFFKLPKVLPYKKPLTSAFWPEKSILKLNHSKILLSHI